MNLVTVSVEFVFLKFNCCDIKAHEENSSICVHDILIVRGLFY